MNNNKQSSVDFIHDSLIKYIGFEDIESTKIFDKIFEQAKAMHKEEMKDFYFKGWHRFKGNRDEDFDEYYNETYESNS